MTKGKRGILEPGEDMSMMKNWCLLTFLLVIAGVASIPVTALALEEEVDFETFRNEVHASLQYQAGTIVLGDKIAQIDLPSSFRYLEPEQAKYVLEELWGNPPKGDNWGMILPVSSGPLDDNSWAVIISYQNDGHVDDEDAEQIDFDELLQEMQADTKEANAKREEDGYETVELIGWAEPPYFSKYDHKLYWAKELQFGDAAEHVLNYDIRILGRNGILLLTAVTDVSQLQIVREAMPQILSATNFIQGNQYADYDPASDHLAAYGVAALVAGGVAGKAGLFKGILAVLLAAKKAIIVGLVLLGASIAKFFKNKNQPKL